MSSAGLNQWIVSGNLASDATVKTVTLKDGREAQVANVVLYVQKPRSREESFTVTLNIWDKSSAWRVLPYLKKGSLVICTGTVEPDPYISNVGNVPRAGLKMTVLDVHLDRVKEEETESSEAAVAVPV